MLTQIFFLRPLQFPQIPSHPEPSLCSRSWSSESFQIKISSNRRTCPTCCSCTRPSCFEDGLSLGEIWWKSMDWRSMFAGETWPNRKRVSGKCSLQPIDWNIQEWMVLAMGRIHGRLTWTERVDILHILSSWMFQWNTLKHRCVRSPSSPSSFQHLPVAPCACRGPFSTKRLRYLASHHGDGSRGSPLLPGFSLLVHRGGSSRPGWCCWSRPQWGNLMSLKLKGLTSHILPSI